MSVSARPLPAQSLLESAPRLAPVWRHDQPDVFTLQIDGLLMTLAKKLPCFREFRTVRIGSFPNR